MADELDTPPPSKLKKVLPLVGVLLLGLGGGFGASMMMGGGGEADAGGEHADAAPAEGGHEAPATTVARAYTCPVSLTARRTSALWSLYG